ncbi:MAG TPA: hypothetical protein EYQ60_13260 [Myxococcales bacterium]|nr:hypothetical protein [Myxococcales bacterium]HIK83640.1 hypothetical protein [Myxococcales bacterium]
MSEPPNTPTASMQNADASPSPIIPPTPISASLIGRTFVHPVFDYFLIGGALSLIVVWFISTYPQMTPFSSTRDFKYFILFSNSAHFASSTVRLYTKPGVDGHQSFPFLKTVLPLMFLAVITISVFSVDTFGKHFRAIYFTWSPYHYAAQAYGLTVMYCYRSGCLLNAANKRLLWWVAMLPFIHNFTLFPAGGLHWLDFGGWLKSPDAIAVLNEFRFYMPRFAFAAVPLLFLRIWRSESRPMPLIGALMLFTNGIWWFILPPMKAFIWATIFHGIQYLAIVIIFHVKDQLARPENRHGVAYHVIWFYGASVALGFVLFDWFPRAYIYAGVAAGTSVMMTVAAINLHHFIVDSFIWRLKKSDNNRGIVDSVTSQTPATT